MQLEGHAYRLGSVLNTLLTYGQTANNVAPEMTTEKLS